MAKYILHYYIRFTITTEKSPYISVYSSKRDAITVTYYFLVLALFCLCPLRHNLPLLKHK